MESIRKWKRRTKVFSAVLPRNLRCKSFIRVCKDLALGALFQHPPLYLVPSSRRMKIVRVMVMVVMIWRRVLLAPLYTSPPPKKKNTHTQSSTKSEMGQIGLGPLKEEKKELLIISAKCGEPFCCLQSCIFPTNQIQSLQHRRADQFLIEVGAYFKFWLAKWHCNWKMNSGHYTNFFNFFNVSTLWWKN